MKNGDQFNFVFGQLVAFKRGILKIAQEDLATILEIPRTAISQIECGKRPASFFEAKVLMCCLGIRPKDLDSLPFYKRFVPKLKTLTKARDLAKLRRQIGAVDAYTEEDADEKD